MTPLLLLFFDMKTVVVVTAILEVTGGFVVTLQVRKKIDKNSLFRILPLSFAGVVIGAYILVSFDNNLLKRIFGGFVILFASRILFLQWWNTTGKKIWPSYIGFFAGGLGGLFGGLFGTAGPPIAVYLENQLQLKDTLRATMLMSFLIIDTVRLVPYTYSSLMTDSVLKICLVAFPPALAGTFLGRKIHLGISENVFRTIIGLLLIGTGTILLFGK